MTAKKWVCCARGWGHAFFCPELTSDAAEALSMVNCQGKGGTSCEARATVLNGCLAMAVSKSALASAVGPSKEDAEKETLSRCDTNNATCQVYHSECALPDRAD